MNSSASFSGQTVAFRRQPPPPQGRSRRPLHRSVSLLSNPSLFDRFPFVFLSPTRYPANFTMVFSVSGHLRPWPRPSSPRAWRRRPGPHPHRHPEGPTLCGPRTPFPTPQPHVQASSRRCSTTTDWPPHLAPRRRRLAVQPSAPQPAERLPARASPSLLAAAFFKSAGKCSVRTGMPR